jgi:hypothetical protein
MAAQEGWLLRRQVRLEGGFQGRTNKLVDSCYSFWQGAALAMCEMIKSSDSDTYDMEQYLAHSNGPAATACKADADQISPDGEIGLELDLNLEELPEAKRIQHVDDTSGNLPFNQLALQRYILHCAQNLEGGGMRDKPGKSRDFYHSCYALSGLSIAQSCIVTTLKTDRVGQEIQLPELSGSAAGGGADTKEDILNALPDVELDWSAAQVCVYAIIFLIICKLLCLCILFLGVR